MQIVREEKVDKATDESEPSAASQELTTDEVADGRPLSNERSRASKLAAPLAMSRSRSRSRHSAVTDKGQAAASLDDLSKLAPPVPGFADATRIAPERDASQLPSPVSDTNSTKSPPGIVISDNPQSPATLIPPTDGSSTRPTKGGVAYPFSLKVDGVDGKDVNASMLTLQSMTVTTPTAERSDTELGVLTSTSPAQTPTTNTTETMVIKPTFLDYTHARAPLNEGAKEEPGIMHDISEKGRPGVDRFYTAAPGAGLSSSSLKQEEVETIGKVERPPVERFETAQEDLNTLAGADEKA